MRLTVPQIYMLSHAARVNYDRTQERAEQQRKANEKKKELDRIDPVLANGKRTSECTMDEILANMPKG